MGELTGGRNRPSIYRQISKPIIMRQYVRKKFRVRDMEEDVIEPIISVVLYSWCRFHDRRCLHFYPNFLHHNFEMSPGADPDLGLDPGEESFLKNHFFHFALRKDGRGIETVYDVRGDLRFGPGERKILHSIRRKMSDFLG